MVSVFSLLNPPPISTDQLCSSDSPSLSSLNMALKEEKISKAAAASTKGRFFDRIRYPPFEVQDKVIATEYKKFQVQPIGHIRDTPKRIPYNSDKKTFHQRTGMGGFEGSVMAVTRHRI